MQVDKGTSASTSLAAFRTFWSYCSSDIAYRMSDTRASKSGLAAEAQKKLEASYSREAEAQVRAWLEEVVGEEIGPDFFAEMKDGTYLCK